MVAVLLLIMALGGGTIQAAQSAAKADTPEDAALSENSGSDQDWGIEVSSVRLTAHNYMVDAGVI